MSTATERPAEAARDPIAWVSCRVASDVLGVPEKTVRSHAAAGRIGVRTVPGSRAAYALGDCLALMGRGVVQAPTPAMAG